jgi:hypothetical protein
MALHWLFCELSDSMPRVGEHPIGSAMEWVARIVAVALAMVLPGLGGRWLDQRFDTHYFTLPAFVFGLIFGIWYLLAITKTKKVANPDSDTPPESVDGNAASAAPPRNGRKDS